MSTSATDDGRGPQPPAGHRPAEGGEPAVPPAEGTAAPAGPLYPPIDPVVGLWLAVIVLVLPGASRSLSPYLYSLTSSVVVTNSVHDLLWAAGWVFLVLVLIRRSGEPAGTFGLTWPVRRSDFVLGLLALFAFVFVEQFAAGIVSQLRPDSAEPLATSLHPTWADKPEGPFTWALLSVAYLVAAFAEELTFRGYLLTQLERVLNSSWWAWFISSLLFGVGHLYQGPFQGMVRIADGMFLGGVYCLCRRVWPVTLAHAGMNLLPVILFDPEFMGTPSPFGTDGTAPSGRW